MNPDKGPLIDNELVDAIPGRTYPNMNPATEAVIGEVADAVPEDMERAVSGERWAPRDLRNAWKPKSWRLAYEHGT